MNNLMDNTSYATIINTQEIEFPELFQKLSKIHRYFEDFSIERHLTTEELEKIIKQSQGVHNIYDVKQKIILETLYDLAKQIEQRYIEVAKEYGVELNSTYFYDDIETDFTFLDLEPGDTKIGFKIWTRRFLKTRNSI